MVHAWIFLSGNHDGKALPVPQASCGPFQSVSFSSIIYAISLMVSVLEFFEMTLYQRGLPLL
jgi:hypothetical protein